MQMLRMRAASSIGSSANRIERVKRSPERARRGPTSGVSGERSAAERVRCTPGLGTGWTGAGGEETSDG